jgi:hypothetical protein
MKRNCRIAHISTVNGLAARMADNQGYSGSPGCGGHDIMSQSSIHMRGPAAPSARRGVIEALSALWYGV